MLEWDKQVEEFNRIWVNHRDPPAVTDSWTDNDWAKGRTEYLTFLFRVKEPEIIKRLQKTQRDLAAFPCVDLFPTEYYHITIKEAGAFLVTTKENPDEYTEEQLPKMVDEAQRLLSEFKPFDVELMNLNNFKSVICVQVHDGGVIRKMNASLQNITGIQIMRNDAPRFLPHISICQFINTDGYDELVSLIEETRERKIGVLRVDRVELVIAELPTSGRYPVIHPLAEFKLG